MGVVRGLRLACVLIGCVVVAGGATPALAARSAPKGITAAAAVVMDAKTGSILWARSPDLKLPPASTTKVMTAIMALEAGQLHRSLRVSGRAARAPACKIHLRSGQRLRLESLLYAILLESANDASVVIAEGLAGSEASFAQRMTARARALGARNTRFRNPHGLTAKNHYSTARDLAIVLRHALRDARFRRIAKTRRMVIGPLGTRPRITLTNHNRLLTGFRVPVVGKTGYTRAAKRCFVGAAQDGDGEVIVSLLGSTNLWGDARTLLAYGLDAARRGELRVAEAEPSPPAPRTVASLAVEADGADPEVRYDIYVASFSQRGAAERLRRGLARLGYRAVIENSMPRAYRVAVGGYPTLAQARHAARQLARHPQIDTPAIRRFEVGAGDASE